MSIALESTTTNVHCVKKYDHKCPLRWKVWPQMTKVSECTLTNGNKLGGKTLGEQNYKILLHHNRVQIFEAEAEKRKMWNKKTQ